MTIDDISILGGGWLGLPLARQFMQNGLRVKLATRSQERLSEIQANMPASMTYQIDIASRESIQSFLQSDCLVINITHKDIDNFKWLVGQIKDSPVRTVVFVSSTSVYPALNRTVNEDEGVEHTQSPLWQIEQLFRQATAFQTTVVRFGGLIDKRRHPGRFFRQGKKLRQPNAHVNLIHLDDCIGVIQTIVEKNAWGEVFNGVADSHPLKSAFYSEMAKRAGYSEPETENPAQTEYKIIDNDKIKSQLGYQLQHPDLNQIDFD